MKTAANLSTIRSEMPEEVVEAMEHIIDYLWDDESRNYSIADDDARENHVFGHLAVVQRWLLVRWPAGAPSGRRGPPKPPSLVDVSDPATALGIRYPIAFTRRAWKRCLQMPGSDIAYNRQIRLDSILSDIALALPGGGSTRQVFYCCVTVPRTLGRLKPVKLKCVVGPDGEGLPVVTVMLPDEN
jgi:hypothetical protein